MSLLTRLRTLSGASAMTASSIGAGCGRARAATLARLGILTDMSPPYPEDAGPGSVVAAKLAADAGTKTDTYGRSMVKS